MNPTLQSAADLPPQRGKVVLITGGNRGLGFEVASGFAAAGATVVLACRHQGKAQAAVARLLALHPAASVQCLALDVARLDSIRAFASAFTGRFSQLDVLVHNAAAILAPQGLTADGFETHLGTNHLGPFALTGWLLPALLAAPAARVVSLSSMAHRLTQGLNPDDPGLTQRPYTPMDAYGRSKLAALLFTHELQRRFTRHGHRAVAVAAHPGYSATNLDYGGFWLRLATRLFAQAPAAGALPILCAATAPQLQGGEYLGPSGFKELRGPPRVVSCSPAARDAALAQQLWKLSERLTGVSVLA